MTVQKLRGIVRAKRNSIPGPSFLVLNKRECSVCVCLRMSSTARVCWAEDSMDSVLLFFPVGARNWTVMLGLAAGTFSWPIFKRRHWSCLFCQFVYLFVVAGQAWD